jgi:multidrug resistance efflux pump
LAGRAAALAAQPQNITITLGVAQSGVVQSIEVGVAITRAQLLVVERDSRVADAQLVDARKKLALLNAGSRAEDIAEAKARRDGAAAFLGEGKADLDQCSVRAPAAGTVKILVTVGQFLSTYAPATLVQLTLDAK